MNSVFQALLFAVMMVGLGLLAAFLAACSAQFISMTLRCGTYEGGMRIPTQKED